MRDEPRHPAPPACPGVVKLIRMFHPVEKRWVTVHRVVGRDTASIIETYCRLIVWPCGH